MVVFFCHVGLPERLVASIKPRRVFSCGSAGLKLAQQQVGAPVLQQKFGCWMMLEIYGNLWKSTEIYKN